MQDYYKNAVTSSSMLYFHKPDKDLKIPYIELSSTSVVNIPYGTKKYPLDVF